MSQQGMQLWLSVPTERHSRGPIPPRTCDGHHHALPRAEPQRPLAAKVLRQDGKHALRATQDGPANQ